MLDRLLPNHIWNALHSINISKVHELRMRVGMPILVNIMGKVYYLSNLGISTDVDNSIICTKADIEDVIACASNNALYSVNDQLVNGYISCRGGIRIGVAGEFVYVNGAIKTIKNIQSLNIRVPHEIKGCSLNTIRYIQHNDSIYNTLVLSPAGAGKTTYIRDLAKQLLNSSETMINLLIVDERCEITGISSGQAYFDDFNCDILSNCSKEYAFDNGIRSLRPDIIITDELSKRDVDCITNAITCGVKVVATIHADNILDLRNKPEFSYIINNKLFDRYVVLGKVNGVGRSMGVYNADLECIGI